MTPRPLRALVALAVSAAAGAACAQPARVASQPASAASSPLAAGTRVADRPLVAAPAIEPVLPQDIARLQAAQLAIPVLGVPRSALRDTFMQSRGNALHEAMDILAPRGTPVVAVADGRIAKLFLSKAGGLTVYQFDATEHYAFYYAHLDRYAPQLAEGQWLRRGQAVGEVGYSGNAAPEAPHLHFAIFKLGPAKQWWRGLPVNPHPVFTEETSAARASTEAGARNLNTQ